MTTDGWMLLEHEETGGRAEFPDDPDVLTVQQSRGWRRVEDTGEPDPPFVPAADPFAEDGDPAPWVDLFHPDLPAQPVHRFPNNRAAVDAAFEAGWRYQQADPAAVKAELAELREHKGGRATAEQRAEAQERAAAAAAVTDEPPVVETAPDAPTAGDGTEHKE
jgi:hypothetical protein